MLTKEKTMAIKRLTQVTPNKKGGWDVTLGSKKLSNHRTQAVAITKGRRCARKAKGVLKIFKKNGRIRNTCNYMKAA